MKKFILTLTSMLFIVICVQAQETITGKVISSEDELGVPGVSVVEKGTTNGVATDIDGNYTLKVTSQDVTLVFSAIGFQTIEMSASNANGKTIIIEPDITSIGEVVVVGFGTQKKENLTGAVATVDSDILEDRPVASAVQALQGAVAGMNFSVGNGGGELGNSLSINIRGAGTIGSGSNAAPLILIDGVEGDLNTLNPQDIESISVLKDAASSSIYGSRAAFGVILVTTKSGKAGDITINYTNNFRWSSPLLQPKMLDSENFAEYWNEAAANAGQVAPFSKETLQKIRDYKSGVLKDETAWDDGDKNWKMYTKGWSNNNWFDIFYQDMAPSQEHNLSTRGGTEKINYYFSANWLGQEGLMKFNTDTRDRYTITSKVTAQVHPMVQMTYSGKFMRQDYGRSSYDHGLFYHNIARRWPTLPYKDPNGNIVYGNEIAHLENGRSKTQTDEYIHQLNLIFTPIEGWNTHVELNYKTGTSFNHGEYLPIYKYDPDGNPIPAPLQFWSFWSGGQTRITESGNKWNFFNPNIYTDYTTSIDDTHNFKFMLGFQSELNKTRGLNAWRDDLYTPKVPTINTTYGENDGVGGYFQHWATAGFFGRINYDYLGKYLLELNGRYDGSSRYLRDKRWNFFPSFSVGWNIAKEDFWEDMAWAYNNISELKLRGSYGELGNQNTGSWYPFYQTMPIGVDNGYWLVNGNRTNTSSAPGIVSSLLTWERVTSWNAGFDMRMFNGRFNLGFDYFTRVTYDMVGPAPQLPATLGTEVPKINNTDMESEGFELEVSWRDRLTNGFSYGAKLTLTDSRQTVTKYPNENGKLDQYYSGREFEEIWGYTTVGIAKTDEEMNSHIANNRPSWGSDWAAGDIMYKDLNGDGEVNNGSNTLDDPGDLKIIGNSTPRYNFGLDLDAQWKGFDVRIFLQGTAKRDVAVGGPYFTGANGNMWQNAGFEAHLDFFRPADTDSFFGPNEDAYYPRPIFDKGWKNYETQTRWLQDGSYIRLKNLQFGYTVPLNITEKVGISKLRVYLSGENLLTFTDMTEIFDPETFGGGWGNGKIYPLSKVYSCGLSLTF